MYYIYFPLLSYYIINDSLFQFIIEYVIVSVINMTEYRIT